MISSLIDTIRIRVAINHQQWVTEQIWLHNAGVIDPITKACSSPYRCFTVPGAYGSKATVWSKAGATELHIEASVPHFFTGQNVFGTENLKAVTSLLVQAVCKHLGIKPTAEEKQAVCAGRIRLARIDLTTHLKLDSDARVVHFIKALKLHLSFSHRNVSSYGDDTLYIDQHSSNRSLKFYNKGRELHVPGHQLSGSLPHRDHILAATQGLLRTEMVLRLRYLGRVGIRNVCDWDPVAGRELMKNMLNDLKLSNVQLTEYRPQPALGKQANLLLAAHMAGIDVATIITSVRALKNHARAIVQATGIDLRVPFVAQAAATSMVDLHSFARVIEFGVNDVAVALGITTALLPKSKIKGAEAAAPISHLVSKSPIGLLRNLSKLKTRPFPLGSSRSTVCTSPPGCDPIRRAKAHEL